MAKPPLSKSKAKWAKNRDVSLLGNQLNYNVAIQQDYARDLKRLVRKMTIETRKEIIKLFKSETGKDFFEQQKEASAMDASIGSMARILMNALTSKFTKLFDKSGKIYAEKMMNQTGKASQASLFGSLKQLSGGLSLKTSVVPDGMEDVVKASIEENVSLIKSIPAQYFKDITGSVMRSITTGRGLKDLIPEISKYDGQTERRANNIALDQTRKAYNSINKQRMQALGVKQFKWIHSGGGQKPRESHIKIDGRIFNFDTLYQEQAELGVPEADRGIPGLAVYCRCTMVPVINFQK